MYGENVMAINLFLLTALNLSLIKRRRANAQSHAVLFEKESVTVNNTQVLLLRNTS